MKERLASINCTNCGASLDLKGGHRVRSLTCGYCGSVMDAHEDFAVIAQYKDLQRPETPLAIGMTGSIKGVEFTIIGTIGYELYTYGEWYHWVSHQIYSPTHGYCWITFNDGHFVFSRRVRILPNPPAIIHFKEKSRIDVGGQQFKAFETFNSKIEFVEGELTWVAKIGDQVRVVEAIDPPYAFEYEMSSDELEYSLSEYLDRSDVIQAFNLDDNFRYPTSIHPAQPFPVSSFAKGLQNVGYTFSVVAAALLVFVFIFGSGSWIGGGELRVIKGGTQSFPFTVERAQHLVEFSFQAPVENNWIYLEAEVYDAETDEPVAAVGREISYYWGYEDGERWTEGSTKTMARVHLAAAGEYLLELTLDDESPVSPAVAVEIREGVMPLRYVTALLVLSLIAALSLPIRRFIFERRRWGEDEDDDD